MTLYSFQKFLLVLFVLTSCSNLTKERLDKSLQSHYHVSAYPLFQNASKIPFNEQNVNHSPYSFNDLGVLLLTPGDYSFPVMTYCMKASASSPKGHMYTLGRIEGKIATLIQKLNIKATPHFPTSDIQIVIWSLQAGLAYEEMTNQSKKIIDQIIPEHRDDIRESFLRSIEKKWDQLAHQTQGNLPTVDESMSRIENKFGEVGIRLREMRDFREKVRELGNNYDELRRDIDTSPRSNKVSDTPWSRLSENISARFLTEGSYGDIGFLQVRVWPDFGRRINSESQHTYAIDIASLIANPNDGNIQPLSFSPMYGMAGLISSSQIALNPRIAALIIPLVLAVYPMRWEEFFKLDKQFQGIKDVNVRKEIRKATNTLRQEHDELEKPLKEAGIISGKDKNTSIKEKNEVREYKKPGGLEQLQKDFEKINGISSMADGLDLKTLPDGTKIVKRPIGSKSGPSLEVQPSKNNPKYPDPQIRVKVRYL